MRQLGQRRNWRIRQGGWQVVARRVLHSPHPILELLVILPPHIKCRLLFQFSINHPPPTKEYGYVTRRPSTSRPAGLTPWRNRNRSSEGAVAFDDQDSRYAVWMCNMFTTYPGEKDIPSLKDDNVLGTCFPVAHIDYAIENNKHLLPIVYMPLVRLISPMQADRGAVHIRQVQSSPGTSSSKFLASNEPQSFLLEKWCR